MSAKKMRRRPLLAGRWFASSLAMNFMVECAPDLGHKILIV